jgi:ribonuclease BN (tRNA processing enzyme)
MTVTPFAVEHTEPTFSLRAEADGQRVGYTADTSPGEHALPAAQEVDLLLAEATLPEEYAGAAPHMTAREAGELAAKAEAGTLVLVHVWPTNDREAMEAQASEAFSGPVYVAEELERYEISDEVE